MDLEHDDFNSCIQKRSVQIDDAHKIRVLTDSSGWRCEFPYDS
jgi:hypothetical protein